MSSTKEARPLPPPGINPTTIKYAAIVPLVAVVMLGVVIAMNIITAKGPDATVSPKLNQVAGLTVAAMPPFAALVTAGEPPPDIVNSIVIPEGATQVGLPHTGGNVFSFDRKIVFSSPASSQALYNFFQAQMKGRQWKIFSTGKPANAPGVEILSRRGGSDSFFWLQGVDISPTTFAKDGSAQSTQFTLRLYQAAVSN